MFRITKDNIITITRGDSGYIPVTLNINSTVDPQIYELKDTDIVYLGITEPQKPFEHAIVRKAINGSDHVGESSVKFVLNPQDTECLVPGVYSYSVKLYEPEDIIHQTYHVHTILDKKRLVIIE